MEKIGDYEYQIGKLSLKNQLFVAKRLAPLLTGGGDADSMFKAFSSMPDDDLWFLVKTCLTVVRRKGGADIQGALQPMLAANGELLFDDLDLGALLSLIMAVFRGSNLPAFFPSLP